MWPWRKNPGNVVGTHPVPARWAAAEGGSPTGGRAGIPPGTPARSPYPAGICPAQGEKNSSVADPWHFGRDPDLRIGSCDADTDTDPDADPDPAIFVTDLQDVNKKLIKKSFFADYFLKVHLRHSSKIKSKKKSQNSRNQCFSCYFCAW